MANLAAAPASAQAVPPLPSPADVEALRRLPVQHDGRVMPLDTLAREAVWNVTGRRSVWGVDPVAMALGWAFLLVLALGAITWLQRRTQRWTRR